LAQHFSTADHIEATNRYFAFGATITGAGVSSLTAAVKSARKKITGTGLDWRDPRCWDVEFYSGTNHLGGFPTFSGIFKLEGVEYRDGTGVMEEFWKKLEKDRTR
jgi:hypothetical protein